jgi:excinuclease ABC subunit C
VKSEFDDIKGIGTETKKLLLNHYKSIRRIKEESAEELEKLIGKHKTTLLKIYFDNKKAL